MRTFDALALLEGQGCSNHGCVISPPKGMGTNGQCKCLWDLRSNFKLRVRVEAVLRAIQDDKIGVTP